MIQVKNPSRLFSLLRTVGYGLLLIAIINFVDIFIPSYFTNPNWELNAVGMIIERMPLALIALLLVFYGETDFRQRWEVPILRLLSWFTLIASILFLLLIPLSVSSAIRMNIQNMSQISSGYKQQLEQLEQLEARLSNMTTQEINDLVDAVASQESAPTVTSSEALTYFKSEIERSREQAQVQREEVQSTQWLNLQKSAIKWSIGACISAVLFFYIWRLTGWAR